jgi:hypothetical protein
MIGFFIGASVFSLLIGITISVIFYVIKKYKFKSPITFRKNIWIAVIVALACFLLCLILINGMDKIIV